MPIKDAPSSQGTKAQLETFKKACSELWPNARRLQVHRKASPKKVLRDAGVVHVKNADGSIVDDSATCIDELVQSIDDDVEKNSPGEYRIALVGVQELPIKGRKKAVGEPEIELKGTGWIRFGEGGEEEDGADSGSMRGILRETGKMIASVSTAVGNIASASNVATGGMESVVETQRKVIEAQAGAFTAYASVEQKQNETNLAMRQAEHHHVQWMFTEEQKERRYQEEREERRQKQAAEAAERREFIERGMGMAMTMFTGAIEDRKAERAAKERAEARARGEEPHVDTTAEPTPPPAPNTIAPKLAAALAHLDTEQHEALIEIFGRTTPRKVGGPTASVWELVVGASKQTSDTDCVATLTNIGLDKAAQVNNGARKAVERELLTAPQAQTVLDACERIGR